MLNLVQITLEEKEKMTIANSGTGTNGTITEFYPVHKLYHGSSPVRSSYTDLDFYFTTYHEVNRILEYFKCDESDLFYQCGNDNDLFRLYDDLCEKLVFDSMNYCYHNAEIIKEYLKANKKSFSGKDYETLSKFIDDYYSKTFPNHKQEDNMFPRSYITEDGLEINMKVEIRPEYNGFFTVIIELDEQDDVYLHLKTMDALQRFIEQFYRDPEGTLSNYGIISIEYESRSITKLSKTYNDVLKARENTEDDMPF